MATAAQILNLANGSGNNEYNLGVGFDSGHTDITPSSLYGGWSDSYYFFPKPDNSAVVFRMKVTGGRTSSNTKYPRCELREMNALTNTGGNDPKASWNGGSGTHWMRGKTKITRVTEMKPWICFAQIHNGGSDLIRLQTEGTSASNLKLVARHTPPGGSEVVTTIQSSYTVGQVIDWKIECINGTIKVYLGGQVKYTGSGNTTGCYFKAGLYLQSSVNNVNNTEGGDTSEWAELEMYDFMTWHTGQPNPAATYYEVNGGTGGTPTSTTVNAGADSTINLTTAFNRTATEAGSSTITSRKWTILAAPAGGGTGAIDNTQAAHRHGWGDPLSTWSDDFNYGSTGSPAVPTTSKWSLYQGPGHGGNGTRDAARCRVHGDRLILEGLASGSTGGMSSKFYQQYGKWEVRARSYGTAASNGNDYHPVLIIWPESGEWPEDGEYDFSENSVPGDNKYNAFIHFPHDADVSVQQRQFTKTGTDLTQWHNFAIEWTSQYIRGYFDGELIFETSGGANSVRRDIQDMPSGGLTIQLDNFDGTSQTPAKFEVDWARIYPLVPTGTGPTGGGSQVGTQLATTAALSWTPTIKGAYTLRYSVTTAQGTFFDDVVVNVVETGGGTPSSSTLGKTTAGASSSASSANKTAVSKHTATADGTLTEGHAHAWLSAAGSATTKCVVYADSSGSPGALLGESDALTITATSDDAVRDYTFSGAEQASIAEGIDYWVGLSWQDPGTISLNLGRDSTASQRQENSSYVADPFGTPTAQSGPVAVWVDVEGAPEGDTYTSPTFVGMTSDSDTSSALILTPPSGLQSGDHQLLFVGLGTASETMPAAPSGFQEARKVSYTTPSSNDTYQGALYVSNNSTVTGDVTLNKSGTRLAQAFRLAWRGGPGFNLDNELVEQSAESTTLNLPGMAALNGEVIVGGILVDVGENLGTTLSTPSGWTQRANAEATNSSFGERLRMGVWDVARTSDGTQAGSSTSSRSDDAMVFAIKLGRIVTPGSGGGATPGTAPEFVLVGSSKSGSSATITMDSIGAASGQMDVIAILSSGAESMTGVPTGWQLMDMIQGAGPTGAPGGPYTGWVYYNTGGAGSASFTKSGTRFWHAVRGVWKGQNGLGEHQARAETSGSGTTSHATPPVSTINPNSRVVGICMQDLQLADPGPYESPPTWTERYDSTKSAGDEREAITIADVVATSPSQVVGSFVGSTADEAIIFAFVLEAPAPTGGGGVSGTKLEAAQAILARLEDPLDEGDFFEDWSYDGMPAVVAEWNNELLDDYIAATGPYEFPGDIESGQVQAWLQSYIDAQTGGGENPGPVGSPTISSGADVTIAVNEEFSRIATEEDNGAAITSRTWTITSGPAGVGTTMSTTATVTWNFTQPGTYVIAYQATNSLGTAVDTAIITVTAAGAGAGHWPRTSGFFALLP